MISAQNLKHVCDQLGLDRITEAGTDQLRIEGEGWLDVPAALYWLRNKVSAYSRKDIMQRHYTPLLVKLIKENT